MSKNTGMLTQKQIRALDTGDKVYIYYFEFQKGVFWNEVKPIEAILEVSRAEGWGRFQFKHKPYWVQSSISDTAANSPDLAANEVDNLEALKTFPRGSQTFIGVFYTREEAVKSYNELLEKLIPYCPIKINKKLANKALGKDAKRRITKASIEATIKGLSIDIEHLQKERDEYIQMLGNHF